MVEEKVREIVRDEIEKTAKKTVFSLRMEVNKNFHQTEIVQQLGRRIFANT